MIRSFWLFVVNARFVSLRTCCKRVEGREAERVAGGSRPAGGSESSKPGRGMADSDDEITAEDVAFFQKRAKTASFLLREQGADPEATSKAQKRIQLERSAAARRKERAALDRLQGRDGGGGDDEGDDEGPRRNRHWQAEAEKERKQALPVKLADGSMKAVMREQALPDPDEAVELPAMSKRAQKRARGERIAEKKALERGEVLVKPGAKPAEEKPHAAPAPTEAKKGGARGQHAGAGAAEQEAERPLTHEEKKAAIADLCSKLMRDPEKSVALLTRVHQAQTLKSTAW